MMVRCVYHKADGSAQLCNVKGNVLELISLIPPLSKIKDVQRRVTNCRHNLGDAGKVKKWHNDMRELDEILSIQGKEIPYNTSYRS